jgi:hypothetical protein
MSSSLRGSVDVDVSHIYHNFVTQPRTKTSKDIAINEGTCPFTQATSGQHDIKDLNLSEKVVLHTSKL